MRDFNKMKNQFGNVTTAKGKFSVGVVFNHNGKRVSVSAALAEVLDVKDKMSFIIDPEAKELLISKEFPYPAAVTVNASGKDGEKKIAYSATVAESVVKVFGLNFSEKTSMSFGNITTEVDEGTGIPFAVVKMTANAAAGGEENDEVQNNGAA